MGIWSEMLVKNDFQVFGLNSWKDGVITAGIEKIGWGFGGTVVDIKWRLSEQVDLWIWSLGEKFGLGK